MAGNWRISMICNRIIPDYIGIFWRNGPIPQWRKDCTFRLLKLYPTATIISDISEEIVKIDMCKIVSDHWRINCACNYARFLWVDNDIWLDDYLNLPEVPALADEYNVAHWSIVWSGNNPDYFKGKTTKSFIRDKFVKRIAINGTHWASDNMGNKVIRIK